MSLELCERMPIDGLILLGRDPADPAAGEPSILDASISCDNVSVEWFLCLYHFACFLLGVVVPDDPGVAVCDGLPADSPPFPFRP